MEPIMKANESKCPACGKQPLIVERDAKSIRWLSVCCNEEMEPDAKALIGTLKVRPSKESWYASLDALLEQIEGQFSVDLQQAFEFERSASYRKKKAMELLDEKGRELAKQAKLIFSRIIGPGCEVNIEYPCYVLEHHPVPKIIKPYLKFKAFKKGWWIEKSFYPRKTKHIEDMARNVNNVFDFLNGLS